MKTLRLFVVLFILTTKSFSQNYGNFPPIEKEKLHRDLALLYQGLDKFHSGMYWYTPKDSVDLAFKEAKSQIYKDLNVLEFYKIVAPLVALSREDHTDILLPTEIREAINEREDVRYLPLTVVFLGHQLYCLKNASNNPAKVETLEIETINGETPLEIASKIGSLFASDGFNKTVKLQELSIFSFSKKYYYYYGTIENYEVKFKELPEPITFKSLPLTQINSNAAKFVTPSQRNHKKDPFELKIINAKTAYLAVGTFYNPIIKKQTATKSLKKFLENSFVTIKEKGIENVIVDVSENGGGNEGNENLLYSYFGENYQKYTKVRAKTQKAVLDNGTDKPIELKTFGFLEKIFTNKKMPDGSYERRSNFILDLMAYKKAPKNQFKGSTYVIISPETYSGASEFANMMYSQGIGTFIGQESGGGYLGNTSGYSRKLVLPHSKIVVHIPPIQFIMNVAPKLPFGSGVKPHHTVIPTIQQYVNKENVNLEYTLKLINEKE